MNEDDHIDIIADGKKIGSFPYRQRRSHRHLFNLAGVELINSRTLERVDKGRFYQESLSDDEDNS
jgi:hypothetical protein